jgi:putative transposase
MPNFSRIFLHINWHCKSNRAMIPAEREMAIHRFIRDAVTRIEGVEFHGVGGTQDHVHLVVKIRPDVLISDMIGRIKGASSHEANEQFGRDSLHWQRGYGVVSFAESNLAGVLDYVARQKEHHGAGTTRPTLELAEAEGEA